MIAVEGRFEPEHTASALFASPECPQRAKCAGINKDAAIVFFDTVPQGYGEEHKNWILSHWKSDRCHYSPLRGSGNCGIVFLIREA